MNVAAQEMTLDEWVDRLPTDHRARRELADLRAQVDKLTAERDEARKVLQEIADTENPEHYGNARDALHAVKLLAEAALTRHTLTETST